MSIIQEELAKCVSCGQLNNHILLILFLILQSQGDKSTGNQATRYLTGKKTKEKPH